MPDAKIRWTADAKQAIQETQKLENATGSSTKKMGVSISDLKFGTLAAFGAIAGAIATAKKAFDFAEQGAQLLLIEQKFGRLGTALGLTSDFLGKVQQATGGTRSEIELMTSATDLMALGLVKNEEELRRLVTVSGELGFDMNQLVLTLSNITTMRFDALGVSVDGFKEKVNALKATGMDAATAFRTAFLEQAEEQVEKVGSAAESAVGPFMQLKAAVADMGAASKEAAAKGLGPVVEVLATGMRRMNEAGAAMQFFRNRIDDVRYGEVLMKDGTRMTTDELVAMHAAVLDVAAASDFLTSQMMIQDEITKGLIENTEAGGMALDRLAERNRALADQTQGAVDDMNAAWGALDPSPLDNLLSIEKMTAWREVGGAALNDFIADLEEAAIAGQDVSAELDLAQGMALALQVQAGEIDLTEAKTQAKDLGLTWQTDVAPYISASRDAIERILAANGRTVRIRVVTTHDTIVGDTGHGRQHGGPLTGLDLVGEAGPEMIVGGVVIPAGETRRLMALGLLPGRRMQSGGSLSDKPGTPYSGVKTFPEISKYLTAENEKTQQQVGAWRPERIANYVAAATGQATAAAVGAVGSQIAALQLAQAQELQRQATQQAAADAEQNRLLREIADAVRATGTPGQVAGALSKELQTFQAGA